MLRKSNQPAFQEDKTESNASRTSKATESSTNHEKKIKTKLVVKYDVGFANNVYIRGKGGNLSWERGIPLKNIKADEWVWESETPFTTCEFKVLINDKHYERGDNHIITAGTSLTFTPIF